MFLELNETRALDLARRDLIAATPTTTMREVLELMRDRFGAVLIVDAEGRLAGIFTERDLIFRIDHASPAWRDRLVGEVMTKTPRTLPADASIRDAIHLMNTGVFRRVPIVDDERRPLGVVSIRDVLRYIVDHYAAEFINLPPDPKSEASRPWGG